MKILTIADVESRYLWDFFEKEKLEGIDLILSAGDLAPQYLSFLATFFKGPILYIHGNHDGCYEQTPPDGCICIEDTVYEFNGVRIFGLGGCMQYRPSPHQFTEKQMRRRILKARFKLMKSHGFDILLTHAPAAGINDCDDLPHKGFQCFKELLDKYQPKLFIHGHVHLNYKWNMQRETVYNKTNVVNAYDRYIIEI